MIDIKSIYTRSLVGVVLACGLLGACSKDRDSLDTKDIGGIEQASLGELINVSMNVPAIAEEVQDRPKAMDMTLEMKPSTTSSGLITPKISLEDKQNSFESVVTLFNKTRNKRQTVSVVWKKESRKVLPNEKHYYPQDIAVSSDLNIKSQTDEIYMLAQAGAGVLANDKLTVTGTTSLDPVVQGSKATMQAPFATSWRRIKWDTDQNSLRLADRSSGKELFKFKPQGVFLVLSLENWMALGVQVSRQMALESNGYATQGYYDYSKLSGSDVSDGADNLDKLWETTNPETEASANAPTFRFAYATSDDASGNVYLKHTRANITLKPASGDDPTYIRMNAGTPTKYAYSYVLWLKKVADKADKNVFYTQADVTDASRTLYTNDKYTYTVENSGKTNSWKPYLGKRYIIGSFSSNTTSGNAYTMKLRTVRPMLPIEHVSIPGISYRYQAMNDAQGQAFRNSTGGRHGYTNAGSWQKNWNGTLTGQRYGWDTDEKYLYDSGSNALYRRPTEVELGNLFRLPAAILYDTDRGTRSQNKKPVFFNGQGNLLGFSGHPSQFTTSNGKTIDQRNDYIRTLGSNGKGGNTVYAVMYMGVQSNNYAVAVRFSIGVDTLRMDQYYIGPNLSGLGLLTDEAQAQRASYAMHEAFWKYCIDKDAVISRTIMYANHDMAAAWSADANRNLWGTSAGIYWYGDYGAKRYVFLTNYGVLEDTKTGGSAFHLPWLNRNAW